MPIASYADLTAYLDRRGEFAFDESTHRNDARRIGPAFAYLDSNINLLVTTNMTPQFAAYINANPQRIALVGQMTRAKCDYWRERATSFYPRDYEEWETEAIPTNIQANRFGMAAVRAGRRLGHRD